MIKNDKKYVRVSEILSILSNFSHIDEEVLKNKCRIGTEVHKAIEMDLKGQFPLLGRQCDGYFKSYEDWKDVVRPTVIELEKRFWDDDELFTGQVDMICKIEGFEKSVLVDFKTSVSVNDKVWRMQANLYGYLVEKSGIELSDTYVFVKLGKDGNAKTYWYKKDEELIKRGLEMVRNWWDQEKKVPF